jgi:hypothetical protein
MPAFTFRLERLDDKPADPPVLHAAVPNWKPGDEISLGGGRSLRVVAGRAAGGAAARPGWDGGQDARAGEGRRGGEVEGGVNVDEIVAPPSRLPAAEWARRARGPGGVLSDAEGRVLANVLQQDLDDPLEVPLPPRFFQQPTAEQPKA